MNECMSCWEAILPGTVRHPALRADLCGILDYYQSRYAGAMYSGCGGGYLLVVSDEAVPGALRVKIRLKAGAGIAPSLLGGVTRGNVRVRVPAGSRRYGL